MILLAWYNFWNEFVIYNSFLYTWFGILVTMFKKVTRSFLRLVLFYSFYFISFGLGFLILLRSAAKAGVLNQDTANVTDSERRKCQDDQDEENPNLFNHKLSAIVKTFVMFTGEIEFSDMTEKLTLYDPKTNEFQPGVLLLYVFVVIFIFRG